MEGIKKRVEYIDLIKVIAMFFVVAYHSSFYDYNFLENEKNILFYVRYLCGVIPSVSVPLFFMANGFMLFNKELNLKKHIIKSVRFSLLAFLWGAIDLIAITFIEHEAFSVKNFALSLWTWRLGWINHLWYIGALVCIYVFFPLIKEVYDRNKKLFYYFVIITAIITFGNKALNVLATIGAGRSMGIADQLDLNWFNMFNPFRGMYGYTLVYFCLGGIFKDFVNKIDENRKRSNIIAVVTLCTSIVLLALQGVLLSKTTGNIWDGVWNGYDTVFTLAATVSIFVLATNYTGRNKGLNRVLYTLSCNALGVYFIHMIFVHLIYPYVSAIPYADSVAGSILSGGIVLVLSLAVSVVIRKTPLLKKIL